MTDKMDRSKKSNWLGFTLLGAGLFFLISIYGLALDPTKGVTQYITVTWDTEKGLPQNLVSCILQTRDGYLWIGTQDGLTRFDGIKFTIFDEDNTPAIGNNSIQVLFEDSRGILWIGTLGGVSAYNPATGLFKRYGKPEGITTGNIYCIAESKDHILWIGTGDGGLFRFDGKQFKAYTTQQGLLSNYIRSLCFDHKGNLWISTSGGMVKFEDNTFTNFIAENTLGDRSIYCTLEDSMHRLWVGTDKGLYLMENGIFIQQNAGPDSQAWKVRTLYEDENKAIWIGTELHGLTRFSRGVFSAWNKNTGFPDNFIRSITGDREGSVWVGTAYAGLIQLKNGKFFNYTSQEGLPDNFVFPIYTDSKGYVWIGTTSGLARYKDGEFIRFTTEHSLTNNNVESVFEDASGKIWVGTDEGINLLRNSPTEIIKEAEYLKDFYIVSIMVDKFGDTWVGTLNGLKKIIKSTGAVEDLSNKAGVPSNAIAFIHEDQNGNTWIGGNPGGLSRYKEGKFTLYTELDGLSSNALNCIYEDSASVLWIGSNNGLSRFKDEKFFNFTKKDGLYDKVVYQVLEDKHGNFWMSSNKGIFRIPKKAFNDLAAGKIKHLESAVFDKNSGMPTNECNGGFQYAGCKAPDGKLWFPTTHGVVVIDPENIKTNPFPPLVAIDAVFIDGISSDFRREVKILPKMKRLEIHFTALSFQNPKQVKFRYKLEGYEDDWIDAGANRNVSYTNLDGGNYTFKVIACNDDGLWNTTGTSFAVLVIPPFWKTPWFIISSLVIFSILSYLIIAFFRKYLAMVNFFNRQKYVGKFKLLEKVGAGGMGTVYKAVNMMDKTETVAIKVLKEEMFTDEKNVKRFKQEAAIIDQLDHPNIVRIIERGQAKNNLFIAMEYLDGKTLSQKIKDEKQLDISEAIHIMLQISEALGKIHSKNIIHRDMKPDNIMLVTKNNDPNYVKILDFGLAKTQFQTRLTQTGVVIGTISYMAPEQISGKGAFIASDIYSLGTMFYEMLTGDKPFLGDTTIDTMRKIMDITPDEPSKFRQDSSPELDNLIMWMLNKKKEIRPTIFEVHEALQIIQSQLSQDKGV